MHLPKQQDIAKYEQRNLLLIYVNSLVFSALFTSDSIAAYLVKAVFNGSGIIMVTGLLSLLIGNAIAVFSHPNATSVWGSYWSLKILLYMQYGLLIAFSAMVAISYWN